MALIAVHGTWALSSTWWQPQSLFMQTVARHGLAPFAPEPYYWSGELGGVAGRGRDPWRAAGAALRWYCRAFGGPTCRPDVLSHSHGIQVVACAARDGQAFGRVLDVSGPVRRDMQDAYAALRQACAYWGHVYDTTDPVILQGEVGGGSFLVRDDQPVATENLDVTGHGYQHSGLFLDLPAWGALGLWSRLGGL